MVNGFLNDRTNSYDFLKRQALIGKNPNIAVKFDSLNRHLLQRADRRVVAGQLVIVPDGATAASTFDEAWMMQRANEIQRALGTDDAASSELIANYNLLQSLLGYSSIGVGSVSASWGQHLDQVQKTLLEIEKVHKEHLKNGNRAEFLAQRQRLFRTLDGQLKGVARYGSGLVGNQSIKQMLGISTRRYLNRQEISGYAQRIEHLSRTSRLMGNGTYVGIMLDLGVAALEIQEACSTGRKDQCERARYVQGGKLIGGVLGAETGAQTGRKIAQSVCAVGVKSIPRRSNQGKALVCAVLMIGAGSMAGGAIGGSLGETTGARLYDAGEP